MPLPFKARGIVMQNSVAGIVHGGTSSDPSSALRESTCRKQLASSEPGTAPPRSPRQPRGHVLTTQDLLHCTTLHKADWGRGRNNHLLASHLSGRLDQVDVLILSASVASVNIRTPSIPSIAASKQRRYASLAPGSDSSASINYPPSGKCQA